MLEAPAPVEGAWDEFRIEQVLTNLLTNAMRYGAGKPIDVTVAQVGGDAHIGVRDHGIGIAPDDHERIFGQFERTESSRKQAPGLGLGLYIAQQIVQAHGGRIRVDSAPGQGACFTVVLPCVSPEG
jgi:signal transduction histidine kinase